MISKLALLTWKMHNLGFNHRDFYLCHILARRDADQGWELFVCDLHRVDKKEKVGMRWRVKDITALNYSAPEKVISARDRIRFLKQYLGKARLRSAAVDREGCKEDTKDETAQCKKKGSRSTVTPSLPDRKAPKIFFLGIDGLSPHILNDLLKERKLPHVHTLIENGCCGELETMRPTNSAVIWTSIITGKGKEEHGIDSFIAYRWQNRVIRKTTMKKLMKLGGRQLVQRMIRNGSIKTLPLSGDMIKVKTLFEILSEAGGKVGVINWWHSWPAEAINGFVISDRINYARWQEKYGREQQPERLTYPSSLLDTIKGLIMLPQEVDVNSYRRFVDISGTDLKEMRTAAYRHHQLKSELKHLISLDETVRKIAFYSLSHVTGLDLFSLYFRGIDIMSHCALQYSEWNRITAVDPEERRKYGKAVSSYYCYMDTVLGELLKETGHDTSLIIASDHGFVQEKNGRFGHRRSKPPGVLILSGGNFKKGKQITGATIFDLAPTILYLSGLPVARDMKGKVLKDYIQEDFANQHSVMSVKSYGKRGKKDIIPSSHGVDEEVKERLKALGYLDEEM